MTRYFVLQYNEKAHESERGKLAGMDSASGGYPWPAVTLGEDYLNHAHIWPESTEADIRKYAASFPQLTVRELHVSLVPREDEDRLADIRVYAANMDHLAEKAPVAMAVIRDLLTEVERLTTRLATLRERHESDA